MDSWKYGYLHTPILKGAFACGLSIISSQNTWSKVGRRTLLLAYLARCAAECYPDVHASNRWLACSVRRKFTSLVPFNRQSCSQANCANSPLWTCTFIHLLHSPQLHLRLVNLLWNGILSIISYLLSFCELLSEAAHVNINRLYIILS